MEHTLSIEQLEQALAAVQALGVSPALLLAFEAACNTDPELLQSYDALSDLQDVADYADEAAAARCADLCEEEESDE